MRTRAGLVVVIVVALATVVACSSDKKSAATASSTAASSTSSSSSSSSPSSSGTSAVDLTKLPLGDGQYTTSPQKGSVDSCITNFTGGGAFQNGPWIHTDTNTWDVTAKIAVSGSIDQQGQITGAHSDAGEKLDGNGLPTAPTGVFPVAATDEAYNY